MHIKISGKHIDVGDALSAHVEDRLTQAVIKYFDRPIKLLGRGKVEKSFQLEVAKASKSAVAAVDSAGGSVTVTG